MTRAVVFAYSEVGARCTQELLSQGVDIPLLFTHEDDPGETRWYGSVRMLAARHGIRTVSPDDPNAKEWIAEAERARPDLLFSFYYRHLLAAPWLEVARLGCYNLHGSLLPKYRGRAPVHWAIIHGETVTGASLHAMLEKPDAGALVDQEPVDILDNDTALDVSFKVARAAREVLRRSLPALREGRAPAKHLDLAQGSYFGRRRPEDGRVDWRAPARSVHNLVRAVAPPFPGAFCEVAGHRLELHETRLDGPARHATPPACLYADGDGWYADCVDGARLKILQLTLDGARVNFREPPPALVRQPIVLA